jgi:hypothetical protein
LYHRYAEDQKKLAKKAKKAKKKVGLYKFNPVDPPTA